MIKLKKNIVGTNKDLNRFYDQENNKYLCRCGKKIFVSELFYSEAFGFFVDPMRDMAIKFDQLDEMWVIEDD